MPTQITPDAFLAFSDLSRRGERLVVTVTIVVEFLSLLRALTTRRQLSGAEAETLKRKLSELDHPIEGPAGLLDRAWELATALGQSDVFDAYGYATAEWLDSEFWTSDRRFFNAVRSAGLQRVRLVE